MDNPPMQILKENNYKLSLFLYFVLKNDGSKLIFNYNRGKRLD